jgi:transposase, IS6 family
MVRLCAVFIGVGIVAAQPLTPAGTFDINKNLRAPTYTSAIPELQRTGIIRRRSRHRPVQYLNNIIEQDHRAIKKRVNAKQGFRSFGTARRTIEGYEAVHMMRKGQVKWVADDDVCRQIQFVDKLFGLAA